MRWTAPELLIDRPSLSKKADVYSFGIVVWEFAGAPQIPFHDLERDRHVNSQQLLFSCQCEGLLVLSCQVIDAVVSGIRPEIPDHCSSDNWRQLMKNCWHADANQRPEFADVVDQLERELCEDSLSIMVQSSGSFESSSN